MNKIALDIAINVKIRPNIESLLDIKKYSSDWIYVCANVPDDKMEVKSYGICLEQSKIKGYEKLKIEKYKPELILSDYPELLRGVMSILKNNGVNMDFVKKMMKISCYVNFVDNYILFDDSKKNNMAFSNHSELNKEDTICVRCYYINSLDVPTKSKLITIEF